MKSTRAYEQRARAEQASANTQRIVDAAVTLVHDSPRLRDITLDQVAQRSGMTVRSALRRFGSRDGLLQAAFVQIVDGMRGQRPLPPEGDVDAAVASLVSQYERIGDLNIKMLEQEHDLPLIHDLMELGRREHRAWLERAFAPQLATLEGRARSQRVMELYAATDVYLWKVFRRDMRLGRKQTTEAFHNLVTAVLSRRDRPHPRGDR